MRILILFNNKSDKYLGALGFVVANSGKITPLYVCIKQIRKWFESTCEVPCKGGFSVK